MTNPSGRGPGLVLACVGLLVLATAGVLSIVGGPKGPETCPEVTSTLVRYPRCHLDVHTPFVVEVDRDAFFAAERDRLATTSARLKKATAAAVASGTEKDARTAQTVAAEYAALAKTAALVLFVNGEPAPARQSIDIASDGGTEWMALSFKLASATDAGSDAGRAWRRLLAGTSGFGSRSVTVGLGTAGADAPRLTTVYEGVTMTVLRPLVVLVGGVGLLLVALGLAIRYWRTGLLRDGDGGSCFSLARVQAAWWLVLTFGGFIFVVLATGQYAGVVTASTLGLMGISGSTMLIARGIDRMEGAPPARESAGFFGDLMYDASGAPALQRIQMVGWTVLLGVIFAFLTLRDLALPVFDPNLLVLSGLVSATYAGFKLPENREPARG